MKLSKLLLFLFLNFVSVLAFAKVQEWQIIPNESRLTFSGIQNGAPVSGEFTKFTGHIFFDRTQLNENNVEIHVDMNSLKTAYTDLTDTLKTAEWFNISLFPQAIFKASHFTKIGDKTYEAQGTLTLRNQSHPLILKFVEEKSDNKRVKISGNGTVKRTLFGVGQGEWASTNEIKDEVNIQFVVTADKKT